MSEEIELKEIEEIPVLQIAGYFNAELGVKVTAMVDTLLQKGKNRIVIDLSQCKVVNSPGLASMIDLSFKVIDDFQGKVVIAGVDQLKINIFTTAGLFPLAGTAANAPEACKKIKG